MKKSFSGLIEKIRSYYGEEFIPLHRPIFEGNERKYLVDAIDSNFVSSVGEKVDQFECMLASYMGAEYAVATVNGTAALHVALLLVGVERKTEVLTQALTFVATCNAANYCGAKPVFIDVDLDSLGMSPEKLENWLSTNAVLKDGVAVNIGTGARISACVPMHTFGLPLRIREIVEICDSYGIPVVEDAAESLGSYVGDTHTGVIGKIGTLSFNGNKVITTGGGGAIVTNDEIIAKRAKHITTTAKIPHAFEFVHDAVGFNYRMPNINAALGCAQIERLHEMLKAKHNLAKDYSVWGKENGIKFVSPIEGMTANYWLNAVQLDDFDERDEFIQYMNNNGVMVRPIWRLMSKLEMFSDAQSDGLENSEWLEERIVNVPSSVPNGTIKEG